MLGEQVGRNLQRIFAFGVRNSFGMTFDPVKGDLWTTENGGRAFDEVNHVEKGWNGGWIQFMGPLSRVAEFKALEIAAGVGANGPNGLQQLRFPRRACPTSPRRPRRGCSTCRRRTRAIPSSAGRTSCRRRRSASLPARRSALGSRR